MTPPPAPEPPDQSDGDRAALRLSLEPSVSAAAAARRLIDRACAEWNAASLLDPARLIVTELVSNAVRHARTPFEVIVARRDGELHIRVHDASPHPPRRRPPVRPTSEGGRGLHVVATLADAWGATATERGKVVWATLPLPA